MKYKEFKDKSENELTSMLYKMRSDLVQFRFNAASGKVSKPSEGRGLRKDIARTMTALREVK
jgi:ribosomal protein L29